MILCDLTAVFFYDKYIKIVQRDKIGEKMRAGRHQHKNEIPIPKIVRFMLHFLKIFAFNESRKIG